LYFVKAYYHDF